MLVVEGVPDVTDLPDREAVPDSAAHPEHVDEEARKACVRSTALLMEASSLRTFCCLSDDVAILAVVETSCSSS